MDNEFSQDWEVYSVVTSTNPNLATLHELQTVYCVKDLYDFLEILDAKQAIEETGRKKAKAKYDAEREKNTRSKGRR